MSFLKKAAKGVSSSVKKDAPNGRPSPPAAPVKPSTPSTPASAKDSKPSSISLPPQASSTPKATDHEAGGRTPRTPADEGIAFFEGAVGRTEGPIQVWQLDLEPDGSPTKEKSVRPLPPIFIP